MSLTLVDASALLWRLHLAGVDTASRFAHLADAWLPKLDGERGFYAFNDVHAMLALVASGREDAIAQLLRDMECAAGANAAMAREVGLPVARALVAVGQQRYDAVIDGLAPVRDIAHRFGGSHAQRDLLTLTLIEAALRSGQPSIARHYLAERTVMRPQSGLGRRLQARAAGSPR